MMASTCKWERGGCNVGVTGEVAVGEAGRRGGGNCENKTDLSPIADVSCLLLITRHTLATGGCRIHVFC